jgi:iron complex outermembrane receptor protein
MKKTLHSVFFVLIFTSFAFAQNGNIRGTVKTYEGNPAESAAVELIGANKGSVVDSKGEFEIKNVEPGTYHLEISSVGLETIELKVLVVANEITRVPEIVLREDTQSLKEVVLMGNGHNKETEYVAKMPLKNLENPQVYNTVSSKIIKQQAITNYDDAFRNIPGVFRTWESTGRNGDGAAFFALRGLEGQPALVNGLPGITNGNLDPANVEEIQVLKGPSGTLFGARATTYSNYGGVINTVTKKPYYTTGGEINYHIGSFGLSRVSADINTPLSDKEKIALRVNTAYHTEGSFQDAGFKESFFFAPTLAYQVSDRLKFLVVTEILSEERAVAPVFFHSNRADPLTFGTVEELNLNNELSFTSNDLSIKTPRTNLQAQMMYQLSDTWNSQTVVSRGTADSDGYYTYIWADTEGDNDFGQYFTYIKESRVTTDIQQNFTGDIKIGKFRNRFLIGFDYFNQQATNNSLGYVFIRNVSPQGDENFVDPYTGETLPTVNLSRASIDNLLADTAESNSRSTNSAYSFYISDVFNITPAIELLASLRADYFDSKAEKSDPDDDFDQFALSPKFGLVYQPVLDRLSIFANYQNSFNNVAPIQVADADGSNSRLRSFKPEHADQWEVGMKTNLFSDRFFGTFSYYNIKVSDRIIGDATNFYNSIQGGEVESKGYELDITLNLFDGLNLIAGFSHNQTENVKGVEGDFYSGPGRVPGGQGPQDQINFWATYRINSGNLKNFGLGLGGNYASEYRVVDNSITGIFDLPAYTIVNSSLFYNSDKFRCTLNVNNLFDTDHYIGYWSVNPQRPRNIVAGFTYKF